MTVLGHIQQGGEPSPFDRILGTKLGVLAIEWLDSQLNNYLTEDGIFFQPFFFLVKNK